MIEMILLLYSFAVITGIGAWVLQHATSGWEIFLAALFAPVSFHLAAKILKTIGQVFVPTRDSEVVLGEEIKSEHADQDTKHVAVTEDGTVITAVKEKAETGSSRIDVDRRLFLKLIGSAGLSVFMMSIFTQKAHAAFFGSLPGSSAIQIKNTLGEKIDPSQEHPTDGYEVTEIDDASAPAYYGFVNATGSWYITREASDGSYRYAKGSSSFTTNWTGRAILSYDYYNNVF